MRARHMASWCLLARQPPEVYMQLTLLEREAFVEEAQGLRERGWI